MSASRDRLEVRAYRDLGATLDPWVIPDLPVELDRRDHKVSGGYSQR